MADGRARDRGAADPVGEELEERTLASGLRPAQGAGAARRDRGRLRGAAERDRRLRRADAEERQRDRAARLELRRALQRGAGGGRARGAWPRPGCPRASVELLAGGDRDELAELATAGGPGRPGDPARRRGAEGGAEGGRDGAGDVRGGGQLPRLRPRRRRPRDGAADRLQREGPAPGRLQRGRDAAGPRATSPASSCPACSPTCATPGSSWSATSGRARPRGRGAGRRRRPTRTGTPSTSA